MATKKITPKKTSPAPVTSFDIEIEAEPREAFTVSLVGKTYEIHRPKSAILMKMAIEAKNPGKKKGIDGAEASLKMMDGIITSLFGKTSDAIRSRLEDPDDALEYEHVTKLIEALMQQGTGNPTTSS